MSDIVFVQADHARLLLSSPDYASQSVLAGSIRVTLHGVQVGDAVSFLRPWPCAERTGGDLAAAWN